MTRLTDHLVVISFDCLSSLDFPLLQKLPNFQKLLHHGSYCNNVESIYPSVTYPCHATIVTGRYPRRHGIINNTLIQPGRKSPDWYWRRSHVLGTTLYDEAKKQGMTTAALLWPVTAKANIDYNMPEIFANRPWQHQIPVSLLNGSMRFQLEMHFRFGHIRKGLSQPELDDFVLESTVETIKKKPHLLLVHFTDLDTQRHYHGFSSEQAMEAINRHDHRLGRIMDAIKVSGIEEKTTIIILGDHSALNESKAINMNVLFREKGLIHLNKKGNVKNWKAYCKSCDGSAYIYLKNKDDKETKETIENLLHKLIQEKSSGIERVLTGGEAGIKGADETADYMLEAHLGYYFKEELDEEFIHDITNEDVRSKKYTIASHGYSPLKENYSTIFMAAGKGIQQNVVIPSMRLIDEGPTFARLLGLDLGDTDGRSIDQLLKSE